jgi:hypothetical protein
LHEVLDCLGNPPGLLIQAAVDLWGAARDPESVQDLAGLYLCGRLGGIRPDGWNILRVSETWVKKVDGKNSE